MCADSEWNGQLCWLSISYTNEAGFTTTLNDYWVDCLPETCIDQEDLDSLAYYDINAACGPTRLSCSLTFTCESITSNQNN